MKTARNSAPVIEDQAEAARKLLWDSWRPHRFIYGCTVPTELRPNMTYVNYNMSGINIHPQLIGKS